MDNKFFKPEDAIEILQNHADTIITVEFVKRTTGELRVLNGRLGVRRHAKGVGMSYTPGDHNLMTIYDLHIAAKLPEKDRAKAYRSINLDAVTKIAAGGMVYMP